MARVLFFYDLFEALGIEYISAVLKQAGHKTSLIIEPRMYDDSFQYNKFLSKFFNFRKQAVEKAVKLSPDLICFSIVVDQYEWALDLASKIKEQIDVPIIFGGIHPSSLPENVIANKCVDIVCIGEGEKAILELTNKIESNLDYFAIPNLWVKKDGKITKNNMLPPEHNLDLIPFPDKDLFYDLLPHYKREYLIMSQRGCPYNCSYCCNSTWKELYDKQKYVRRRSVDNVIEELNLAKEKYSPSYVIFRDELFAHNSKWIEEFSKKYKKEIDLPFKANSHPLISEDIVKNLSYAGCFETQMGVQSINYESKKLCNRFESNEKIIEAVNLLKKEDVLIVLDHIFGFPNETEDDLVEAAKFYNDARPSTIDAHFIKFFPQTPLLHKMVELGYVTKEERNEINNGNDPSFLLGGSVKDYKQLQKFQTLLFAIPLLPKNWVNTIIEKKLYNYPPFTLSAGYVLSRFVHRTLLGRKSASKYPLDLGARAYTDSYKHFAIKKITGGKL